MTRLLVAPDFMEAESLTSYWSRLAAANNVPRSRTFAQHMGIHYQDVSLGAPDAVEGVAKLSGVDVSRLRKGTATRVGNEFHINGEILTDTFYNRSSFRYCPHCLRDDLDHSDAPIAARPFRRLAWTVGFVRTCHVHGVFLATLPMTIDIGLRDDFSAIWRETSDDNRKITCQKGEHSEFERYILHRLEGKAVSEGWIDTLHLYVVGHMSETIGAAINLGTNFRAHQLDLPAWHAAGETGFQVLRKGLDHIVQFLRAAQQEFLDRKRNHYSGQALYGTLFRRLEGLMEDINYDPIRNFIREHAIRTLPFGPEDLLFGKLGMPRRLHSIKTASDQSGLSVKLLRSRLLHTGIIAKKDLSTTPHRVFIDVAHVDKMLEEMAEQQAAGLRGATVEEKEAGAILGVGRDTWSQIARSFDLREKAYARVARGRVEAFLEALTQIADRSEGPLDSLHDPTTAAIVCACKVTDVLHLILSRKLKTVVLDDSRVGIGQVLVDRAEIWAAIHGAEMKQHLTSFEAADLLFIDIDSLSRLARSGALSRSTVPGGGRQFFYLKKDVEHFNSTYASTARIGSAAGVSTWTAAAMLRDHDVEPEFGKTGPGAHVYLVSALKGVFDPGVLVKLRSRRNNVVLDDHSTPPAPATRDSLDQIRR
ncbi:hypothetical protein ACVJBD_002181 [Rhizobium mongolense]